MFPYECNVTLIIDHDTVQQDVTFTLSMFFFVAHILASPHNLWAVFQCQSDAIPIIARFLSVLGADCLLLGWGLGDDNALNSNEKFRLADYYQRIEASGRLWHQFGTLRRS